MATKAPLIIVAALAFSGLATVAASAASPAYCALYAREYAIDAVQPAAAVGLRQSVEDQAYYRCLNQDEDPPLPTASAYFAAPERIGPRTGIPPGLDPTSTGSIQPDPARSEPARTEPSRAAAAPAKPAASPPAGPPPAAEQAPQGGGPSWFRWIRDNAAKVAENATTPPPAQGAAPAAVPAPRPTVQPTVTKIADAGASATKAPYKGSGLTAGTPEWVTWCAKNFPRSWDPATGTVVHGSGNGERVQCR
jgi:hypothetical protein